MFLPLKKRVEVRSLLSILEPRQYTSSVYTFKQMSQKIHLFCFEESIVNNNTKTLLNILFLDYLFLRIDT